MRKLMLAATIAALPYSTVAADEDLVGTYKLISSTRKILDTGEVQDTWGKDPNGFIIYGKDGRMLVLIVRRDRPKPERASRHRWTAHHSLAFGVRGQPCTPSTKYACCRREQVDKQTRLAKSLSRTVRLAELGQSRRKR